MLSGWESSCCLKFLLGATEEGGKYVGIWANILVFYGTRTLHCRFSSSPIILALILPPPLLLAVAVIVIVVLIVTTLLHLVCVLMNVILQSHIFSALLSPAEPSCSGLFQRPQSLKIWLWRPSCIFVMHLHFYLAEPLWFLLQIFQ